MPIDSGEEVEAMQKPKIGRPLVCEKPMERRSVRISQRDERLLVEWAGSLSAAIRQLIREKFPENHK
jgi:hypothetical protein